MSGGRFEKGRWVEETLPPSSPSEHDGNLEGRVAAARSSFGKGLDDLLAVGRDMVTTEEGRRHIGRTMDKASEDIMARLEDTAKAATDYISSLLEQKRKE
ncbi:MAG: hypothetical protein CVV33_01725 [Methanomicrobiales archaeon HGW-Methanomicrobiales-4]|nr:MAG: hypothetical protein CVV33_01725 [Methanomicrobiales archaeon HGW-Methanomicrobiales-4]